MKGKKGLIMGVANERSIAWGISQKLADAGAELAFTYLGDALKKRVIPLAEKLNSKTTFSCDVEIKEFADSKNIPCIMTSDKHERALDRVAEAIENSDFEINEDDIVLNVQGDEPMMQPDMISATVKPMIDNADVNGVVLSMPIIDEAQFNDPNTLKIIIIIVVPNIKFLLSNEI